MLETLEQGISEVEINGILHKIVSKYISTGVYQPFAHVCIKTVDSEERNCQIFGCRDGTWCLTYEDKKIWLEHAPIFFRQGGY